MFITPEQITEAFEKIPDTMVQAINKVDVTQAIQKLAQENNLHIDQQGVVYNEVMAVLLGLGESATFVKNLEEELGIQGKPLDALVHSINETIFGPVRMYMRETKERQELLGEEIELAPVRASDETIEVLEAFEKQKQQEQETSSLVQQKDVPKRNEVLNGIEDPVQSTTPSKGQLHKKLNETTVTPTQKATYTKQDLSKASQESVKGYKSADPYREPIE